MGIFDVFKKKKPENDFDPTNIKLDSLKPGYFLDYDLKTWEVVTKSHYDYDGDVSYEWQLKSSDETLYLEQEVDDESYWSISNKVPIGKIGSHVTKSILESDDPPDAITVDSIEYYLEESGGGYFHKDGKSPGKEFLYWSFENEAGDKFITIERWGENEFEASKGFTVEEYQFTDITPSA
ncbi:MAG: DUF4178 domain-containing protein [Desulfobacterales bacterium]|nr:DUF4178 domain-containing protein [Desulfobacterales bacterium]